MTLNGNGRNWPCPGSPQMRWTGAIMTVSVLQDLLCYILKMIWRLLIHTIIQPIRKEQIAVGFPAYRNIPGRIIVPVIIFGKGGVHPTGFIPFILIIKRCGVIFTVSGDKLYIWNGAQKSYRQTHLSAHYVATHPLQKRQTIFSRTHAFVHHNNDTRLPEPPSK